MSDSIAIVCLTRGQSIGLALDAEAGLISFTAVVVLLGLILVSHGLCHDVHNVFYITMQIKVYRSKIQCPMDLFVVSRRMTCEHS
jgi:hypothetical protein